MRFAAYSGFTVTLAAAVLSRAYLERPNWYSRMVYIGQSDASIMIMANLALLIFGSLFYAMQRAVFGPLRPIEREQLYENCWYQVTETLLALTIFRESFGWSTISMFVILIASKIWQWLVESRVEFVEQQPPASPTWFYKRLTGAILFGCFMDWVLLHYSLGTFVEQARPGIMVLFTFEFALLLIAGMSNACRYTFILRDMFVSEQQLRVRVETAKARIRAERAELQRQIDAGQMPPESMNNAETEDSVDPSQLDVPGWEEKGRFMFLLDLLTDLIKLVVYIGFFSILLAFHGLPIHILRDVFLTIRSFVKRINDFVRYRRATQNMNFRYADATAEDLSGDNTCIICREEMQPWDPARDPAGGMGQEERHRPKKLPCGHILHMSCLRGWLERQQVCPTCRRPVLAPPTGVNPRANLEALRDELVPDGNRRADARPQPRGGLPALNRFRIFNIGPFRFAFGGVPERQIQQMNQMLNNPDHQADHQPGRRNHQPDHQPDRQPSPYSDYQPPTVVTHPRDARRSAPVARDPITRRAQIRGIYTQISQDMNDYRVDQEQLRVLWAMELELVRLGRRRLDVRNSNRAAAYQDITNEFRQYHARQAPDVFTNLPQTLVPDPQQPVLSADSPNMPPGMMLPPGYHLVPFHEHRPAENTRLALHMNLGSALQSMQQGGTPQQPHAPTVEDAEDDE